MCHVTKYCNVIGLHCTVRRDMASIRRRLPHGQLLKETNFTTVSSHAPEDIIAQDSLDP